MHHDYASLAGVDENTFKAAMRCIASTVTVITSRSGARTNGMTATAVCSVSAVPPSILVVVNQTNRSHALIAEADSFAVNVLSADQADLAQHFARKSDDPLQSVKTRDGVTGVPVIDGCAALLECVVQQRIESGTHTVFIGRVVATQETSLSPLMYWNGDYVELTAKSA
jgi:flavin reductase